MCFVSGSVPVVRSVDMMLVHNSDKVKLVCRVKADRQLDTEIFWRRDGARLAETRGKIRIRQKRTKSVLTLARVEAGELCWDTLTLSGLLAASTGLLSLVSLVTAPSSSHRSVSTVRSILGGQSGT